MIVKRRTKKGEIRYGVRVYRREGFEWVGTRPKLGRADGDPAVEAKALEAQAAREARRPKRPQTCDAFVARWLEQGCPTGRRREKKQSTVSTYADALRPFARDFAGVPLGDVTRDEAFEWANDHRGNQRVVATMFSHARDLGIVDRNPFERLGLDRSKGRQNLTPMSEGEVARLADCAMEAHGDFGHTMKALVLFAAYTGMRPGELYALEWEDIDFEAARIHVKRALYRSRITLPKSNRARTIYLHPKARQALIDMRTANAVLFGQTGTGLVFRTKLGHRFESTSLSNSNRRNDGQTVGYWPPVRKLFGRDLDFYELRHFAGHHYFITLGLSDEDAGYQLGHKGGRLIRDVYGHGQHGALDRIDAKLNEPHDSRIEGGATAREAG